MTREELEQNGIVLQLLSEDHIIKPFDCEDETLNDFLLNKAKGYKKEFLATTFILENKEHTVAYYSIFNASLFVEEDNFASKSSWKKFLQNLVSHPKRHLDSFPALKIGRLGISKEFKGLGLGRMIINLIINEAYDLNNTHACKVVSVDAYKQSINFYVKQGFIFMTDTDKDNETRQMYFDVSSMSETGEETGQLFTG